MVLPSTAVVAAHCIRQEPIGARSAAPDAWIYHNQLCLPPSAPW